jgi:glutamate carboxypeptidase
VDGVQIEVAGGINRPPLQATASGQLFTVAQRACRELGLAPVGEEHVGGGSDGNFAAAVGAQVLDGLGAVGEGPHTRTEWISETALAERAALLARLVELLTNS